MLLCDLPRSSDNVATWTVTGKADLAVRMAGKDKSIADICATGFDNQPAGACKIDLVSGSSCYSSFLTATKDSSIMWIGPAPRVIEAQRDVNTAGAIAGGVIGAFALLALLAAVILYRRRSSNSAAGGAAGGLGAVSTTPSQDLAAPLTGGLMGAAAAAARQRAGSHAGSEPMDLNRASPTWSLPSRAASDVHIRLPSSSGAQ